MINSFCDNQKKCDVYSRYICLIFISPSFQEGEEEEEGEAPAPEEGGEEHGSREELDDEMCNRNRRKSEVVKMDGIQMNHVG